MWWAKWEAVSSPLQSDYSINLLASETKDCSRSWRWPNQRLTDWESPKLAALHLWKAVIIDHELKHLWLLQPAELMDASANIPSSLKYFLQYSGYATDTPTSRVQCLVSYVGQDLVYAVSNGRQKTPKHILLPSAVKSLTPRSWFKPWIALIMGYHTHSLQKQTLLCSVSPEAGRHPWWTCPISIHYLALCADNCGTG